MVVPMIIVKQCKTVISQFGKFILFMAWSEGKRKFNTTAKVSTRGLSTQQKQVDKMVEFNITITFSMTKLDQAINLPLLGLACGQ
jgi:hypothetical protein